MSHHISIVILVVEIVELIVAIIFLVACSYGNWLLYKCKYAMFMQKRGVIRHFGLNFSLMLQILSITFSTGSIFPNTVTVSLFTTSMVAISCYSFICFTVVNCWMRYFREQWTFYTLASQWQSVINDKFNEQMNVNWFITNKCTYGSNIYVLKVAGIYHFFAMILATISMILLIAIPDEIPGFGLIILYACFSLPFLISVIFYITIECKTTKLAKVDDIFLIHWEAQHHSRALATFVAISILGSILNVMTSFNTFDIARIFMSVVVYYIHHISTFSLLKRLSLSYNNLSEAQLVVNMTQNIAMKDVLQNTESFHLFMVHLSKEYSMEILLSLCEFTQYQQYLLSINSDETIGVETKNRINIPDTIPMSSIVEDENTDFTHKAQNLYMKYVRIDAEYQINICFARRKSFDAVLSGNHLLNNNRIGVNDMYNLFQHTCQDMLILLRYSYARFQSTTEFDKITELLGNQKT